MTGLHMPNLTQRAKRQGQYETFKILLIRRLNVSCTLEERWLARLAIMKGMMTDKARRKACKVNLLQKILEEPVVMCVDILGSLCLLAHMGIDTCLRLSLNSVILTEV